MTDTKLIILRGPSGSGKTTVSKILFERAKNKVALIEQDHYRFMFRPAGGGSKLNSDTMHKMIKSDTLLALEGGYDVILEGILSPKSYDKVLQEIFAAHPSSNFIYYFDISFEETVRRHATRQITRGSGFDEKDMRQWYPTSHKSDLHQEIMISEVSTLEDTALKIVSETKL